MSQFTDAAEAIKRIASMLEGFQIAAAALEKVGSFDNAAAEATVARDAAVAERDAVLDELVDLHTQIEQAKIEQAIQVSDASDKARALVEDAERIANERATGIISDANAVIKLAVENAQAEMDAMKGQTVQAKAELTEVLMQQAQAEHEIETKQAQLSELTASLDALKARLGA